jgi:hypothetical protein
MTLPMILFRQQVLPVTYCLLDIRLSQRTGPA